MVGKTFLRNFAAWKSCLGEVLDLLHWCEEVDEDTSAGWGSSSNHRHLLYRISRIPGCWWRLGWHVPETTIRHPRSAGSSFSSLQFRRKSASFQVCWTAWIVGWEFYLLSPSSVVLDRLLLMPWQSTPILVTREAKWRLNFSGTWSKLMQNNQIVVEKQHLCFIEKKEYRKSFWEGMVVGTPNFSFCDSLPWLFDQSIFNSDPISKLCRNWNPFSVETNKVTTPLLEGRNSAFKHFEDSRPRYHFFVAILPLITDYNFCEKKLFWVFSHFVRFLFVPWHRLFAQGRIILGISFALMIQIILSLKLKCAAI